MRISDWSSDVCSSDLFKKVWTDPTPEFDGAYARFKDISVLPLPVQKPHPPLWIGGESGPALRRAARLGDGWFPIGKNPKFQIGRASCRERVCPYVSITVVAAPCKKKNKANKTA